MYEYQLKSIPEKRVALPNEIFMDVASRYYRLTGKDKHNTDLKTHGMLRTTDVVDNALKGLNLEEDGLVLRVNNMLFGETPIGQDFAFLAIARAVCFQYAQTEKKGFLPITPVLNSVGSALEWMMPLLRNEMARKFDAYFGPSSKLGAGVVYDRK